MVIVEMTGLIPTTAPLYQGIRDILLSARTQVRQTVNTTMVQTYWQIGRLIVEDEQGGEKRAEYGKRVLTELSRRLSAEFGKGFAPDNLRNFRQFYLCFSKEEICDTVCSELSWSHFRMLMRIENKAARTWYANESATQNWSVRALDRQISTLYYERLIGSQKQDGVREQGLIDRLQQFLMELGKGFAFVARQKRLQVEGDDFFVDLVFYNYLLKCFVLIDLKIGKLAHQDVGQLDMYVRVFDEQQRGEGDNPTIGLILCSERNAAVAKYSALADKPQLFASKYQTYLPSEEELRVELERDRALLESAREASGD